MNKKVVMPAVALIAVLAAGGLLYFAHIHALEKADRRARSADGADRRRRRSPSTTCRSI